MTDLQRYEKTAQIQAALVEGPDDVPDEFAQFVDALDDDPFEKAYVATNKGYVLATYPFWLAADAEDPDHAWPIGPDRFEAFYEPVEADRPADRIQAVADEIGAIREENELIDDASSALWKARQLCIDALNGPRPGPEGEAPEFFYLVRHEDVSGISGEGVVAMGLVSPDGHVLMGWTGEEGPHSLQAYHSLDDVREIHGHDGKTEVVPVEELPQEAPP